MCTVSYITRNNEVYITSNRDEQKDRNAVAKPQSIQLENRKITFPQDAKSGGTWFAYDNLNTVIVLLNGAKEKHQKQLGYRKSRGLIVLEIIENLDPLSYWKIIDLEGIEPFTLILLFKTNLFHLQWDGVEKHQLQLNEKENHIWSSSTLYTNEIQLERRKWFESFQKSAEILDSESILNFHSTTHSDDKMNGLVIDRFNEIVTINITQLVLSPGLATLKHLDLVNKTSFYKTAHLSA